MNWVLPSQPSHDFFLNLSMNEFNSEDFKNKQLTQVWWHLRGAPFNNVHALYYSLSFLNTPKLNY